MLLYHISQTLRPGDRMTPDYRRSRPLAAPFLEALERSEDCFYGTLLSGAYLYAVLEKSGLRQWADYVKWAAEAVFEHIRKTEFPGACSRLACNYFYADLAHSRQLFETAWGEESEEDRAALHLFEVEVDDPEPQRRDMSLYDTAYDALAQARDLQKAAACARAYFSGKQSAEPFWEILSDRPAKVLREVPAILRP